MIKTNLLIINNNQQRINIFIADAPHTKKSVDFMIHGKQFQVYVGEPILRGLES